MNEKQELYTDDVYLEDEEDCAAEEDEILVKDAKGQTVKLEVKDDAEYDPA